MRRTRDSRRPWVDRSGSLTGHTWSTCARKKVSGHPTLWGAVVFGAALAELETGAWDVVRP